MNGCNIRCCFSEWAKGCETLGCDESSVNDDGKTFIGLCRDRTRRKRAAAMESDDGIGADDRLEDDVNASVMLVRDNQMIPMLNFYSQNNSGTNRYDLMIDKRHKRAAAKECGCIAGYTMDPATNKCYSKNEIIYIEWLSLNCKTTYILPMIDPDRGFSSILEEIKIKQSGISLG